MSGLRKQAKYLTEKQVKNAVSRMGDYRNSLRNRAIIELGLYAGLRAKEISLLRWEHITDGSGEVADRITLTDDVTKGRSGGLIPINGKLAGTLKELMGSGVDRKSAVIRSEKGGHLKTQSVVNLLWQHYRKCDIEGASSHSGRRTFITNVARNISQVGGSMRDVMALARHKNLATTQRYVEQNTEAQKSVVGLI